MWRVALGHPAFAEVVEHSCSIPSIIMGETNENLAKYTDTYSYRQVPLALLVLFGHCLPSSGLVASPSMNERRCCSGALGVCVRAGCVCRQPLGVVSGICPFNFPAMIPLWMFPMATVCGNTFVLKPSERDPGAAMVRPLAVARLATLPAVAYHCPRMACTGVGLGVAMCVCSVWRSLRSKLVCPRVC